MESNTLIAFLVTGLVLTIATFMGLTTFGEKHPRVVLTMAFVAFGIYISMILVKIGVIDFG